jgi:ParB family chromosome partitioning protein
MTTTDTTETTRATRDLPIGDVYANPGQPRKHFDDAELAKLAGSIREHGLIEPVIVIERHTAAGRFRLVAGERRWRAHLLLGLPTILAIVRVMTDDEAADVAIIENLARVDVRPLEEAQAYAERVASLTAQGCVAPVVELARRLGMSQPQRIRDRLALLSLTPTNREALDCGALKLEQAAIIATVGPADQRVLFDAIAAGRLRNAKELRATTVLLKDRASQVSMPDFGRQVVLGEPALRGISPAPIVVHASPASPASPPPPCSPSSEDREHATRLERKIDTAVDVLAGGFDGNEVVVLRRVSRTNADVLADKIEIIERGLAKMRVALRAAAVADTRPCAAVAEAADTVARAA